MTSMGAPWLSVLCVIKDDPDGLRRTLHSLVRQDLEGVEIVIVDSSADRSEVSRIADRVGIAHTYSWMEPCGIYPAMNHGLSLSHGEFAYFANAGDELFSPDVLGRVRTHVGDSSWAFGPIEVMEQDGSRVVTPRWDYHREKRNFFARGLFPSHQGTFARTTLLRELGGFDGSFRIAADYAMALKLSRESNPVQLPFIIARFYEGGASTHAREESFHEFHRARVMILGLHGLALFKERLLTFTHGMKVRLARARLVSQRSPS